MRLPIFSLTLSFSMICMIPPLLAEQFDKPEIPIPHQTNQTNQTNQEKSTVISINLNDDNDGWNDNDISNLPEPSETNSDQDYSYIESNQVGSSEKHDIEEHEHFKDRGIIEQTELVELPGKEINFNIKVHSSSHYLIDGRTDSDVGKLLFKSRLMPSNEVKLSIKLKQREMDDIELIAYFDLANFTMELDGANSILNKEHKQLMKIASAHLQYKFEQQYKDYDFPEHALMLVQMLSYWSVSPEGYIHEKRSIISQ